MTSPLDMTPRQAAQKKIDAAKHRLKLALDVQRGNARRDAEAVEDARRQLRIAGQALVDLARDEEARGLVSTPAPTPVSSA